MTARVKTHLVLVAMALLAGSAVAARFIEESFDYADNTQLNGQTATGVGLSGTWAGWRNPSQMVTTNGSLSYGLLVTANRRLRANYTGFGNGDNVRGPLSSAVQTLLGNNGSTFWYSVVVRTPSTFVANKSLQIGLDRGDTYNIGSVRIEYKNANTGSFRTRIGNTSSSTTIDVLADTTLFIVFKLTRHSGTQFCSMEGWVYDDGTVPTTPPADGSGSALSSIDCGTGSAVQNLKVVCDYPSHNGSTYAWEVDEFRAGHTFADVTPVVPEPTLMALVGIVVGLAWRTRLGR